MTLELLILFLLLGSVVGVIAGLLGIGGGLVVVPALVFLLPKAGISSEILMHMALATSLATIIMTSLSSALSHLKLGNVDMFAVKWLMPGVLVGGYFGATIADWIPHQYLPKVFSIIVMMLAWQMFRSIRVVSDKPMPNPVITMVCGSAIGIISSLVGVGGGSLSVPFLNRHGVEMRKSVGSSAVCGFAIAISGMLGFVVSGYQIVDLPPYSLGYVYLPALIAIAATSMLTTRVGARLSTKMPTASLKRIFALFLMFVAVTMLVQ